MITYSIHEKFDPYSQNLDEVEFFITITPLMGLTFTVGPFASVDAAEEYMAIYIANENLFQFLRAQRKKEREYYARLQQKKQEKAYDEMLRLEEKRIRELLRIKTEYLQHMKKINDDFLIMQANQGDEEQSSSKPSPGQH